MKIHKITGRIEGSLIGGTFKTREGIFRVTSYCLIKQRAKDQVSIESHERNVEIYVNLDETRDVVKDATVFCEQFFTAVLLAYGTGVTFQLFNIEEVSNIESLGVKPATYIGSQQNEKWEPYMHGQLPSNLVQVGGYFRSATGMRGYGFCKEEKESDIQYWISCLPHIDDRAKVALALYKRGITIYDLWQDGAFLSLYNCILKLGGGIDKKLGAFARKARNRIAHPEPEILMDDRLLQNCRKQARERLEKYIKGKLSARK